jgi:DNA primase
LALVPSTDGAYLCHAGCSVEEIRSAIGQPKEVPASTNGNGHKSNDQTYTALQVGKFVGLLLNGQTSDAIEARDWLSNRGIPSDLIAHYQLGLMCTPKGIGIPIPLGDGTYGIKTRRFPLDSSGIWHQKGIPALVLFTYNPEESTQTWLCEGEWDALLLGWKVRDANLPITVATFTCGARSVPPESELRKLSREVVIFYDRDEAGTEGSQKVAQALQKLGKSARIAQVPCNRDPLPKGWDISDALLSGVSLDELQQATEQAVKQKNPSTLLDAVHHLAIQPLTYTDRHIRILDLATTYGKQPRDVEKLLTACEQDTEQSDDWQTALAVLPHLQSLETQRLNLSKLLPQPLADALMVTAQAIPTTPEALLTTLIPALGSRIGGSSRIVIKPSSNYVQPCIFRTALVANTGDRKTPTQMAILAPLYQLEREAAEQYKLDKLDYDEACKNRQEGEPFPPFPTRKRFIINQGSYEGKIRVHAENPRGLLDYTDELAARFARMNQYRHGQGDDAFNDLSEFNGGSLSRDKVGSSDYLSRTAISSTGSIQWETLRQLQTQAGADDHAGVWARWLFCGIPMPTPQIELYQQPADLLSPLLRDLYLKLENLPPADYFLSDGAKDAFQPWQHALVHRTQSETHLALKATLPKLESYCARLALLLHCLWGLPVPAQMIAGGTMQRAIQLTNWFGGQMRLVLAHNSPINQKEGEFLKILNLLQRKGSLTARDIRNYCWTLRTKPMPEIRQMMVHLSQAGLAGLRGQDIHLHIVEKVERRRGSSLPPLSQSQTAIQTLGEAVEAEGGVYKNPADSPLPDPPNSLRGGGILYSTTDTPQPQSAQALEAIETPHYSPPQTSTPDAEPDVNYFDVM